MARTASKSTRNAPRDGETSAEAIARYVRRLVFEGELEDGQRLPQDDIADAIGVSRIPVREAIIALEREGWVTVVRHHGAFVNGLDAQAVTDRFALYGRFYGFACRRAIERMTPEALESLQVCAAGVEKAVTPAAFERANTAYLSTLVRLAGSGRLSTVLRSTTQIVPGNFFAAVPNSIQVQKDGIAEIHRALEAGDAPQAIRAFAATEQRHAVEVVAMMATRRSAASAT
jgi:DNA-binding GntR family transcriptional regulator